MTQDLLTITGIAQKLGMPESTVRYYRNKFPDFIPAVGEGRKRKYRPETLEVISVIEKMFRENRPAIEIAEQLANKFSQNIDLEKQPQQVIATTPQQQPKNLSLELVNLVAVQTQALKQVALVLDKFYNHERELKTLSDEVIFLRKQLDKLRHNHKYDRELETLSDEVIFLRKRLGNGHDPDNKGLNKQNGLHKKVEEISNYLKQLEKKQIEAKATMAGEEQRVQEIEMVLSQVRKPWWVRLLGL